MMARAMTNEELATLEAQWKAAVEPRDGLDVVRFDSDLIEKGVPKLIAEIKRLRRELELAYEGPNVKGSAY